MVLPMDPGAYVDSIRRRDFPYVIIDHSGVDERTIGGSHEPPGGQRRTELSALAWPPPDRVHHRQSGDGLRAGTPGRVSGSAAAGRNSPYEDLVAEGNFHQPLAYECTRNGLALPDPPTAIFAANDVSAFGVMDAVRDARSAHS